MIRWRPSTCIQLARSWRRVSAARFCKIAPSYVTAIFDERESRRGSQVLVTHHLSLCKAAASMVIHIKEGRVDYCGDATGFLPFEDEEKEALEQEAAAAEESKEEKETPTHNDADAEPESGPQSRRESDAERRREERDKATTLKMIEEEKRAEGRVSVWTYVTYIRAGGAAGWILLALLLAVEQLASA